MQKIKKYLPLVLAFTLTTVLFAQGNFDMPDDPDVAVPIDGGIFTVVGAAAAYGAYKLRKEKGEKSDENID